MNPNPMVTTTDDKQVTQDIKAQEELFQRLYNNGQIDTLVQEFYSKDARFLPPNLPLVQGRDDLAAFCTEMRNVITDVNIGAKHVWSSGDLAVAEGTYTSKVRHDDGSTSEDQGKYVEVFRRGPQGGWECILDTFTSDLPPHA